LPTGDVQDTDGAEVTVNVTNGIHAEWEQVGENCSCAAPIGALAGTVNESENAPELLILDVPSVVPHPLTLIDVQPTQSLAEAVTLLPGGPWEGERVGAL
jgi:hypothetical protein